MIKFTRAVKLTFTTDEFTAERTVLTFFILRGYISYISIFRELAKLKKNGKNGKNI